MAREFPRVTHKVFAGSAAGAANGVAQPGSKQSGIPNFTTSIATIQALAAWANGLAAIVSAAGAPSGVPAWASGTTYNQYNVVSYSGQYFQSLVNSNLGNIPSATPASWMLLPVGATKVPPLEELNAILLEPSYQLASILEAGIPDWDSGTTYSQYSFVQVSGVLYQSLMNSNIGNAPASSPTQWIEFFQGISTFWGGTATGNIQAMAITVSNLPALPPNGTTFIFQTPATGTGTSLATTLSINSGALTGNIVDVFGNEIFSNTSFSNGYIGTGQLITVVWNGTSFVLTSSTPSPSAGALSVISGLGSSQNNYNPGTGWVPTVGQLELLPTANISITGLVPLQAGTMVIIQNISASNTITFNNQNSSSSAANRFVTNTGSDITISAGGFIKAIYSGGRWLIQ